MTNTELIDDCCIVKSPDLVEVKKFGVLAYVTKDVRLKIFDLPFGGFKKALKELRGKTAWRLYRDRKKLKEAL